MKRTAKSDEQATRIASKAAMKTATECKAIIDKAGAELGFTGTLFSLLVMARLMAEQFGLPKYPEDGNLMAFAIGAHCQALEDWGEVDDVLLSCYIASAMLGHPLKPDPMRDRGAMQ